MGIKMTANFITPPRSEFFTKICVTCATARTNTRSKNSSSQLACRSLASASSVRRRGRFFDRDGLVASVSKDVVGSILLDRSDCPGPGQGKIDLAAYPTVNLAHSKNKETVYVRWSEGYPRGL